MLSARCFIYGFVFQEISEKTVNFEGHLHGNNSNLNSDNSPI